MLGTACKPKGEGWWAGTWAAASMNLDVLQQLLPSCRCGSLTSWLAA